MNIESKLCQYSHASAFVPWLLAVVFFSQPAMATQPGQFVDVTVSSGVYFLNSSSQAIFTKQGFLNATDADINLVPRMSARAEVSTSWDDAGVAAGDYDGDGLPDLFALGGSGGSARLFRNNGNGTFTDKAAIAGVAISGEMRAGAMFADYDGDGDLDLFVGGLLGVMPKLYRNNGPGGLGETTFTDVFTSVFNGYSTVLSPNNYVGTMADYDGDGDLDVFFAHSMSPFGPAVLANPGDSTQHLWRNDGATFTDVSIPAEITAIYDGLPSGSLTKDQTFSPNFVDINEDGWPDLLIASDAGGSRVLRNDGDGTFSDLTVEAQFERQGTSQVVAGMGSAVGDFDNDGHFDWFVSQIRTAADGNRLYKGKGDATFTDLVQEAATFGSIGMESGHWGWGACAADLDNDRNLDIVHVNGRYWDGNPFSASGLFSNTPAVAFISNGNGTFTDRAAEIGLDDHGEGLGISCVDYDRDGDVDIAISNFRGSFKLFRNTLSTSAGFVTVTLTGAGKNPHAIGARVILRSTNPADTGPARLMRQMSIDGNYVSSNLTEAHFGIGTWQGPFEVEVRWPDGQTSLHGAIARNTFVNFAEVLDTIYKNGFE